MDALRTITSSGLTFTLSPAQLIIGAGLLGVVFAGNAKSLLLAWHGRLFSQLARHFFLRRSQLTIENAKHGGEALFAPVVTSSYTPVLDIDYNLHKSNSTFFNDLDDNRTELMLALFKNVVKPKQRGKATLKPKMFNLGATSCIFKKPIAPFARYELSSRVLCWDQKWVYVVSHFTKPGSNKPTQHILGPRKSTRAAEKAAEDQQDRIYATAITKYVFKQGRITCTPESILMECGLLPPHPTTEGSQGLENGMPPTQPDSTGHWSAKQVQQECEKYLEIAQNFGSLEKLHGTFIGSSGPAMYTY